MSTEEEAYEDVLEFVEGQMEKLYEEEAFLNSKRDNDEFTEDGERAKWTYFQNFTESEQELMEKDFNKLFDDLLNITKEGLDNLLTELTIVDPNEEKDSRRKKNKNKNKKPEERPEDKFVIVCKESEESDTTTTPSTKCEELLRTMENLRRSVLSEIDRTLDTKFTVYRRSLQQNRAKNHSKLMEARNAIQLFRQKYEHETTANVKDRDRQLQNELEEKYRETITKLEDDVSQYVASVNLKTQRNLALNEELSEYKAANAQLNGKCERIFEDLSNSYRRCEHAEKNERIAKKKLFETQKKLTQLQKAAAKLARSNSTKKMRRSSSMNKSSVTLMSQLSIQETDSQLDHDSGDDFIDSEQPEPCRNCTILQEQLENYKQKIKQMKSSDSSWSIDRSGTGISDVSLSRATSQGECHTSPNVSRQSSTQEEEVVNTVEDTFKQQSDVIHEEIGEDDSRSNAGALSLPTTSEPMITTETPHVPAFDDHSHNIMDTVPTEIIGECGPDESMSLVTADEKVDAPAKSHADDMDEDDDAIKKDENVQEVVFINNSENVTDEVIFDNIFEDSNPVQEKAHEVVSLNEGKRGLSPVCQVETVISSRNSVQGDSLDDRKQVQESRSEDEWKDESNDSSSVQSSPTAIVANIKAAMKPAKRRGSNELVSLEMSEDKEDGLKNVVGKSSPIAKRIESPHPDVTKIISKQQQTGGDEIELTYEPDESKTIASHLIATNSIEESYVTDQKAEISSRMSVILHSPSQVKENAFFPREEDTAIAKARDEELEAMKKLLSDTVNTNRSLQSELYQLKNAKEEQDKYISELSGYIKTQDHIYNLKLKEREILLRELTQQTHDLRKQVLKDKKRFDEMKEIADSNLPQIGLMKLKAKKLESISRRKEFPHCKLDLNVDVVDFDSRPATSGGLTAFNAGITRPSSRAMTTRPTTTPAFNVTSTVHEFCGAATLSRPSQYSSTGIDQRKIDHAWKDFSATNKRMDNGMQFEIEEVRKKVALLVSHQDITMKRLRAKSAAHQKE